MNILANYSVPTQIGVQTLCVAVGCAITIAIIIKAKDIFDSLKATYAKAYNASYNNYLDKETKTIVLFNTYVYQNFSVIEKASKEANSQVLSTGLQLAEEAVVDECADVVSEYTGPYVGLSAYDVRLLLDYSLLPIIKGCIQVSRKPRAAVLEKVSSKISNLDMVNRSTKEVKLALATALTIELYLKGGFEDCYDFNIDDYVPSYRTVKLFEARHHIFSNILHNFATHLGILNKKRYVCNRNNPNYQFDTSLKIQKFLKNSMKVDDSIYTIEKTLGINSINNWRYTNAYVPNAQKVLSMYRSTQQAQIKLMRFTNTAINSVSGFFGKIKNNLPFQRGRLEPINP